MLKEKWISTGENRGTSINYYDKTDGFWHQIWVDNSGYVLKLKGRLLNGSMILKRKITESEKKIITIKLVGLKIPTTR